MMYVTFFPNKTDVRVKLYDFSGCLPADVLLTIFKFLDQRSLGRVAQVSSRAVHQYCKG
jgi:hypothetical protein